MGGSSSTSATNQQTTNQSFQGTATANVAPVFEGLSATQNVNNSFSPDVASSYQSLVNLTGDTVKGANSTIATAFQNLFALNMAAQQDTVDIAKAAGAQIAASNTAGLAAAQAAANPNLPVTVSYLPYVLALLAAAGIYVLYKKGL